MNTQTPAYPSAFCDWHQQTFGLAVLDAKLEAQLRFEGWQAAQASLADKPGLEICDKYGHPLQLGDVVTGHCGYIKSDGYLPKAAPKTLRALLKVHWNRAEGAFELRPVGIHPEDVQWAKQYWYRQPLFEFKVSSAKDARGFYAGPRTDMVCESLEYLDPAQVKLFLADMWAQLDGFRLASYACGLLTSRDPLTR